MIVGPTYRTRANPTSCETIRRVEVVRVHQALAANQVHRSRTNGNAESGGLVTSKGVKCKRARKMMLKCGKRGKRPSGWHASMHGASLKLSKGNKHVKAQLAGGAPPRMNQCLN